MLIGVSMPGAYVLGSKLVDLRQLSKPWLISIHTRNFQEM